MKKITLSSIIILLTFQNFTFPIDRNEKKECLPLCEKKPLIKKEVSPHFLFIGVVAVVLLLCGRKHLMVMIHDFKKKNFLVDKDCLKNDVVLLDQAGGIEPFNQINKTDKPEDDNQIEEGVESEDLTSALIFSHVSSLTSEQLQKQDDCLICSNSYKKEQKIYNCLQGKCQFFCCIKCVQEMAKDDFFQKEDIVDVDGISETIISEYKVEKKCPVCSSKDFFPENITPEYFMPLLQEQT